MRSSTRCTVLAAAGAALALTLIGCESTPPASAEGAALAATSPVNQRQARQQAEWAEAIAGLDFDSGLVRVQRPPRRSDVVAARQFLEQGEADLAFNRKIPAARAFAQAVQAAPDMVEPYLGLGRAMTLKGNTNLAAASYRTALELDPNLVHARVELAHCMARDAEYDHAIAHMQQVLGLDPEYAPAHERLAVWHYYRGDYAEAWDHVHAARDLGHDMPGQFMNLLTAQMPDPAAG